MTAKLRLKLGWIHWLLILIALLGGVNPANAAQPPGEEYTVQADDWLSKIAERFYGNPLAYPLIVDGTNAQAAEDDSFAVITDPNRIEVGQKLWISPEAYLALVAQIEQAARDEVVSLYLASQSITVLPPEIEQLTNLQTLNLNSNNLKELPPEIWQLTNLQGLALGNNNLTELPAEIGQLTNLQGLYLSNNNLTELPAEIGQLTNLQTLNLGRNNLTELPAKIEQLPNLTIGR